MSITVSEPPLEADTVALISALASIPANETKEDSEGRSGPDCVASFLSLSSCSEGHGIVSPMDSCEVIY